MLYLLLIGILVFGMTATAMAATSPTSVQGLVTDQMITINTANQTGSPPQIVVSSLVTNTADGVWALAVYLEDMTSISANKNAPVFMGAITSNDRTVIMGLAIDTCSYLKQTATNGSAVNTTLASSGIMDANAGQPLENTYITYLVKEKVCGAVLEDSGGGTSLLQASAEVIVSKNASGSYVVLT